LKDFGFEMNLRGEMTTAAAAYDALVASINNVYDDVVNGPGVIDPAAHAMEFDLYDNLFRVVDGPW
jgi:hypothetical protein